MDDIRTMLQDAADALMGDAVDAALLQRAEQGGFDHQLWGQLAELGFTRALAGESSGGSDLAWGQVYPLVHAAGRHTLPLPLPETMLAHCLLDRAGCEPPAPDAVLTVAQAPAALCRGRDGATVRFTGRLPGIPYGRHADRVVVAADVDGAAHIGWIELAGEAGRATWAATAEAGVSVAREPRDTLVLEAAVVRDWRPVPSMGTAVVWRHGAMLRAAQIAGAIEQVLALSLSYASEREQFGRPLARFQAIQHHLAELGCEAAAAAMAAAYAFECMDEGGAGLAVASAKIRAGRAAGAAAALAHAVHGALGFTYEHRLHYATRRLWSWRSEYGSHGWWSARLGRALCADGAPHWWDAATGAGLEPADDKETAT